MITFRTGNSLNATRMKNDLRFSPSILKHVYPENGLDQKEQIEKIDKLVECSKTSSVDIISTSEVMYDALRLAVKDGRISNEDLQVIYYHDNSQHIVKIFLGGGQDLAPNGFMDGHAELLAKFF